MKKTSHRFIIPALGLLALAAVSGAQAKGPKVVSRGTCADGVKTKLTASPENGSIELEYELDNAAPNQAWRVILRKNGRVILRTTKRTNGVGDLKVRKLTANGAGNERIQASARRVSGGATCDRSLTVPF